MEIAFCRIDDRLIHGQVATVWTKMTGCNRIMCVNDDVAQDEMRKKLLIQVAPPGIKAYVIPVDKSVAAYKDPKYDSFKTLFLFTNPADVVRAVKGASIMGIIAAMEEKRANGADISQQTLSGVKVGLIGPLAGVGDPIFWGTLRPVLAALGAGIALTGSIIGPIIFFVAFNALRLLTHWYGVQCGYEKGTELVDNIGGNKMRYLTEGSSVLGLLVMGALVAKWTTVNMPLVLSEYVNAQGEIIVTTVQSILDSLMPSIVPLLMTFACMYLLRKGVNPLLIILGLFAIGIIGYAIGLLA